jgi:hypothetical protein
MSGFEGCWRWTVVGEAGQVRLSPIVTMAKKLEDFGILPYRNGPVDDQMGFPLAISPRYGQNTIELGFRVETRFEIMYA